MEKKEYQGTYIECSLTVADLVRGILANDVVDVTTFRFLMYRLGCKLHRTGDSVSVYYREEEFGTYGRYISNKEITDGGWNLDGLLKEVYIDEGIWTDSYSAFPNAETGKFCPPFIEVVDSNEVGYLLCRYYGVEPAGSTGTYIGAGRRAREERSEIWKALLDNPTISEKINKVLSPDFKMATQQ